MSATSAIPAFYEVFIVICERDRITFGSRKRLDAIGKIDHGSPSRSKTFRFPTLPGVSPPIQRIFVFGVTKLACSFVSDMGVVYLVVPTHTKVKRDSICRVCHACTHILCLFLFTIRLFFPPFSLASRLHRFKLLLFHPRLVLLSPSHLFLLLCHMSYVSLLRSLSFLLYLFLAFFAFNIFTFCSSSLQVNSLFLYWFSKYIWERNKVNLNKQLFLQEIWFLDLYLFIVKFNFLLSFFFHRCIIALFLIFHIFFLSKWTRNLSILICLSRKIRLFTFFLFLLFFIFFSLQFSFPFPLFFSADSWVDCLSRPGSSAMWRNFKEKSKSIATSTPKAVLRRFRVSSPVAFSSFLVT